MSKLSVYLIIFFVGGTLILGWAAFNINTINKSFQKVIKSPNSSSTSASITPPTVPYYNLSDSSVGSVGMAVDLGERKITSVEKVGYKLRITYDPPVIGIPNAMMTYAKTLYFNYESKSPTTPSEIKPGMLINLNALYFYKEPAENKTKEWVIGYIAVRDKTGQSPALSIIPSISPTPNTKK